MSEILSTRRLALAGTIGPVVFVVIVIVITALEWDFMHRLGWHLVRNSSVPYPSSTAMGPYGWIQTLNFVQLGLSIIAIGIGLRRAAAIRVGAALMLLAGLGMLLLMFTTDGTTDQPTTWHGAIHALAFLLTLFAALLAAVALAVQLRNNAQWRGVARASIAVPVLIVATFFLGGAVQQAGGLIGIISFLVVLGWYELLGLRLLSLTSEPSAASTG
jgi:hypothetical membrane protein